MADQRKAGMFGIRHLSPAGACYVREFLDEQKPDLVLIEGPSDFDCLMESLTDPLVKPPVAIMAYTKEAPIRTVLYPFAEYSPEYQAALWARQSGCMCRFMDLPSGVFLGLDQEQKENHALADVYRRLDQVCGENTHETFWEHVMEQADGQEAYRKGTILFGENIRRLSEPGEWEENRTREAYMCRIIDQAVDSGIPEEKIAVIAGAYHIKGLLEGEAMGDEEAAKLPCLKTMLTMMPYSYYRLSMRAGYGAGNQAPAYYELLWKGLCRGEPEQTVLEYLTRMAEFMRKGGNPISSASVIEAVRLAGALAELHGYRIPSLKDLRDAAVACMGQGQFSRIALAAADTETGTKIGSLPEGMSQTSIQTDFYQQLEELRLTKYKSMLRMDLHLDLREKLNVKSKKAATIDLERSFFLHQLRILAVSFAHLEKSSQEKATWAEHWQLQWTPEAEIQLVEAVLKGDTIAQAVSGVLSEQAKKAEKIGQVAQVIEEAYCCRIPEAAEYGRRRLQELAIDAASVEELGRAAESLSVSVSYGDIRHLDASPLIPVLEQLFIRACLILPDSCICDAQGAAGVIRGMEAFNRLVRDHAFIEEESWLKVLGEIAERDDLNTKISGLASAMLLERGKMDGQSLARQVERRLSKGMPADLGAGWFEGLAMKNHYALIARMSLWESLNAYLDTLDDEEFKRALVFLRRAFADFSSAEKNSIAENLGELWQINPSQVSEVLNEELSENEEQLIKGLEDFDFELDF